MITKRIVLMAGEGEFTNIVYNALNSEFVIYKVILEQKENRKSFLKRRIKKLGLIKVIGQVIFQFTVPKYLNIVSGKRKQEIIEQNEINISVIPVEKIVRLPSVNSGLCIEFLKNEKPDLVIVNGTRIISQKVLEVAGCRFINTHMGITPAYRGAHGMYWALYNGDKENAGTTVHFVDKGIDTGNIILQQKTSAEKNDNFVTYPYLQIAAGVNILKMAVRSHFLGSLQTIDNVQKGGLWYNPTMWQYLHARIWKKIK